jgi:hypothetical protein
LENEKLGTLVLALDTTISKLEKSNEIKGGRDELQKKVEGLQKKVDYHKCQIEDYHELAKEGKVEFEKVCQDFEILNNRVLGQDKKVFLARNCDVIKTLYSNFQKGLSYQNLVATLLSNLVNKLGFEKPLLIGLCPFGGFYAWFYTYMGRKDNFLQACISLSVGIFTIKDTPKRMV